MFLNRWRHDQPFELLKPILQYNTGLHKLYFILFFVSQQLKVKKLCLRSNMINITLYAWLKFGVNHLKISYLWLNLGSQCSSINLLLMFSYQSEMCHIVNTELGSRREQTSWSPRCRCRPYHLWFLSRDCPRLPVWCKPRCWYSASETPGLPNVWWKTSEEIQD